MMAMSKQLGSGSIKIVDRYMYTFLASKVRCLKIDTIERKREEAERNSKMGVHDFI
jgi:hypothetical protein